MLATLLLGALGMKSIADFGVSASNDAAQNKLALERAIAWAHPRGAALYVDPSDAPYRIAPGVRLLSGVSLVGAQGPVGRGTKHPTEPRPVGSVFEIRDASAPLFLVESATRLEGLQFWYPEQAIRKGETIREYPPTIQKAPDAAVFGVTLSRLSFFGEWMAMDFAATAAVPCEQVLVEHCYGYPFSGTFVRIDHCYDIPRILHCHVNPANRRLFAGDTDPSLVDQVVARKTYAYDLDHTDNAQLLDVFTFGTFGGARLGPATYGQMTNFNFDCVSVGVLKEGDQNFNRNWMLGQGSIIANTGPRLEDVHPILVRGKGHLALTGVEAFSGPNGALTTFGASQDFLCVEGDGPATISMVGCRMRGYVADGPITIRSKDSIVRAVACFDKNLASYDRSFPESLE